MVEVRVKKVKRVGRVPGKANVYSLDGSVKKEIELPMAFRTELRPDIISRASVSIRSNRRQAYAPKKTAGMRHSVRTWGKGHGVARVQRLRQGSRGAQAPLAVGGRRAHPPKVVSDLSKGINRKEMKLARMSALAASSNRQAVRSRGHEFPDKITLPVIVDDELENITTTKEALGVLEKIGLSDDLQRAVEGRKIRAGRGKMRGRKYRNRKSLLIVLSDNCPARRSFSNILGVDVSAVNNLNVEKLAPGGLPGRLMLISESALGEIGKWSL